MIFVVAIWVLVMLEMLLKVAVVGLALYFPYFSGFLIGSLVYFVVRPMHNLIPGHPGISGLVVIGGIELIIFALLHISLTKTAIIVLLCVAAPSCLIILKQVRTDSWQLALFLTVVHLGVLGAETAITMRLHDVNRCWDKSLGVSIMNAVSYSLAAAIITYSVTYCYWDLYMEHAGKSELFMVVKAVVGIAAMVAAFTVPIMASVKNKAA